MPKPLSVGLTYRDWPAAGKPLKLMFWVTSSIGISKLAVLVTLKTSNVNFRRSGGRGSKIHAAAKKTPSRPGGPPRAEDTPPVAAGRPKSRHRKQRRDASNAHRTTWSLIPSMCIAQRPGGKPAVGHLHQHPGG